MREYMWDELITVSPPTASSMHGAHTSNHNASDESYTEPRAVSKRRRCYVRAACNICRTKRKACDGLRPTCHQCSQKGLPCRYVTLDASETQMAALKRKVQELQDQLHHQQSFMTQLKSAPEDTVLELVKRVRSFEVQNFDVRPVENGLYRAPHSWIQSISPYNSPFNPQIDLALELSVCYPHAYPTLVPISTSTISINNLFDVETNCQRFDGHLVPAAQVAWPQRRPLAPLEEKSLVGGPVKPISYWEARLSGLCIEYWTSVPINKDLAASILSFYFDVDNPWLGLLDTELFLRDLVACRSEFCSPFLVATLMFYGCQLYASVDRRSSSLVNAFFAQAEVLWRAECSSDSLNTIVALQLFSLGCSCNGRDHFSVYLCQQGRSMAERMKLLGVGPAMADEDTFAAMLPDQQRAAAHAAWGTYVWLTYRAFSYADKGVLRPPVCPIPDPIVSNSVTFAVKTPLPNTSPNQPGSLFAALYQLCLIAQDISNAIVSDSKTYGVQRLPIAFVERKYRELLAWAERLPRGLMREDDTRAEVLSMHVFFHVIVLSIFRPFRFLEENVVLRTFSASDSTVQAAYAASFEQLKRLLLDTRLRHPATVSRLLSSTGLAIVCAAVLREKDGSNWRFFFFFCVAYYQDLHIRYALYEQVLQGIFALAVVNNALTPQDARKIMEAVRRRGQHHRMVHQCTALFAIDLDHALTDTMNATASAWASKFEELTACDERPMARPPY